MVLLSMLAENTPQKNVLLIVKLYHYQPSPQHPSKKTQTTLLTKPLFNLQAKS